MAKTIVLHNSVDAENVAKSIDVFAEEIGYPLEMIFKQHDKSIVSGQRGLYWRWISIIAKELGYTKEEFHEIMKERFFLNVYLADQENHPVFIGIVDAMQIVKKKAPGEFKTLRNAVMHGVSHLDATKENWIEVLNSVSNLAQKHNIRLPAAEKRLVGGE